jgi:hypothetical protein
VRATFKVAPHVGGQLPRGGAYLDGVLAHRERNAVRAASFEQRDGFLRRLGQYERKAGGIQHEGGGFRRFLGGRIGVRRRLRHGYGVALDALRRLRAAQATEKLAAGTSYKDGRLVFSDPLGEPIGPDSMTKAFARFAD